MAVSNNDRIAVGLGLVRDGLRNKCEAAWQGFYGPVWLEAVNSRLRTPDRQPALDDVAFILKGIKATWQELFGNAFGNDTRALVFEVSDTRNKWAHQETFSSDDTLRALDSMERLLETFGAPEQRAKTRALRRDLMRQVFDQEAKNERKKTAAKPTEGQPFAGLTPWRDVVSPHTDVASDRFIQAEFAADLLEVHLGTAEPEYQNPKDFFARTYLTTGLEDLLVGAARRLSAQGGEPVIELQTNFGGGKTHSMIALYHLAGDTPASELPGVGDALLEAKVAVPTTVSRAVMVGQMMSVSAPVPVEDGVLLHTMWGQLAYQLGGRRGYEMVRADDEAGTNPGRTLKALFEEFGPAVVLIDEWVAYARQLRDGGEGERLAGGDFDTQFTFAQALTEAAAAVPNVVLLVSIPASELEAGGERGRSALEKLKNVVTRKASQWQPASPDESFEIVRRRLFDPITAENAKVRDGVIRAFVEMYRDDKASFPAGVTEPEYRKRMELSYPIHPELFDRLFVDWSTREKFQRTRGALRFMATAIHQLWERGDHSLMIMPGNLPMDSGGLVAEMKKYLEDGWDPVIKSDVDGENALPMRIDNDNKHFGRISATRRAARAVYVGSAARPDGSRGVDIKSITLACAQPGEPIGQFADALKRLSGEATHLYVDGSQYWYSLQPNVTRLAGDRADSNYDAADADHEIQRRLLASRDRGPFVGVHVFPDGPGDVPDEDDGVRLIVLRPTVVHIPGAEDSPAVAAAAALLAQRSAGPRLHRNLLTFVAASGPRLEELRSAARSYLAWKSICDETDALNLTPHQQRQATSKAAETSDTIDSRIFETFTHVLTPTTSPGSGQIDWQPTKPSGAGSLAERVANKLQSEEKLITAYGGIRVRMDLDRIPLWAPDGSLRVADLWAAYTNHPYLARLASFDVLSQAISDGTSKLNWRDETFAYADVKDDDGFLGVSYASHVTVARSGYVIRPDAVPPESPAAVDDAAFEGGKAPGATWSSGSGGGLSSSDTSDRAGVGGSRHAPDASLPTHFYARFSLDPVRGIRQLEDIMANVTNHLGAGVTITLEVEAENPGGFDDRVQRTANENAKHLNAETADFD